MTLQLIHAKQPSPKSQENHNATIVLFILNVRKKSIVCKLHGKVLQQQHYCTVSTIYYYTVIIDIGNTVLLLLKIPLKRHGDSSFLAKSMYGSERCRPSPHPRTFTLLFLNDWHSFLVIMWRFLPHRKWLVGDLALRMDLKLIIKFTSVFNVGKGKMFGIWHYLLWPRSRLIVFKKKLRFLLVRKVKKALKADRGFSLWKEWKVSLGRPAIPFVA